MLCQSIPRLIETKRGMRRATIGRNQSPSDTSVAVRPDIAELRARMRLQSSRTIRGARALQSLAAFVGREPEVKSFARRLASRESG